eukprot:8425-Hanusia_phi.AAC.2
MAFGFPCSARASKAAPPPPAHPLSLLVFTSWASPPTSSPSILADLSYASPALHQRILRLSHIHSHRASRQGSLPARDNRRRL